MRSAVRSAVRAVVLGLLGLFALPAGVAEAQGRRGPHFGYLIEPAAAEIRRAASDSLERAYCVTGYAAIPLDSARGTLTVVYGIHRAQEGFRTRTAVGGIRCPDPRMPLIHTHPNQGGRQDCNPSTTDYRMLLRYRWPFAAVVCDGTAVRFFWPGEARAQLGEPHRPSTPVLVGVTVGVLVLGGVLAEVIQGLR